MGDWTDATIAAAVVLVLAVLIYRVVRREPRSRSIRMGVFFERETDPAAQCPTPAEDPEAEQEAPPTKD